MPDEKTHADTVQFYHTGDSDATPSAQTDPDASLGNYMSSTAVSFLGVSGSVSLLTIDFASGNNGTGDGSLTVSGVSEIKWTAPGGTLGAGVTILNGETKVIEDGADIDKLIRVTRTSATNLGVGSTTITLSDVVNNVVGFDDISSAEASAGDTEYRAIGMRNESGNSVTALKLWIKTLGTQRLSQTAQLGASGSGTIESSTAGAFNDWPATGWCHIRTTAGVLREVVYYSSRTSVVLTVPTAGRSALSTSAAAGAADDTLDAVPGIRIAKEAPTGSPTAGNFTDKTGAGEGSQPAGLTWRIGLSASGTGDEAPVDIGTLATLEIYALWIEREVPAGRVAEASIRNSFAASYDATP